jgi:hypothetical protein
MFLRISDVEILVIDEVIEGLLEYGVVVIAGVQWAAFCIGFWSAYDRLDAGKNGKARQE